VYEIRLVMNIVWEIALGFWPLLGIGAVAWLVLMALAWRRPAAHWRSAWPMAAGIAVVAAVVGFKVVPTTTGSSLHELAYWVDWANLGSIALGSRRMARIGGLQALLLTNRIVHVLLAASAQTKTLPSPTREAPFVISMATLVVSAAVCVT
jgi:hypothetical protein